MEWILEHLPWIISFIIGAIGFIFGLMSKIQAIKTQQQQLFTSYTDVIKILDALRLAHSDNNLRIAKLESSSVVQDKAINTLTSKIDELIETLVDVRLSLEKLRQ